MIYAWPKGRVIRIILAIAAVGIGFDFGWAAWSNYSAWIREPSASTLVTCIVYGVLALGIAIGGLLATLMLPKPVQFLIEVEKEMLKVTWPGRADVIRSTIMIAVLTVILALLIFAVDYINGWIVYENVLDTGRSA